MFQLQTENHLKAQKLATIGTDGHRPLSLKTFFPFYIMFHASFVVQQLHFSLPFHPFLHRFLDHLMFQQPLPLPLVSFLFLGIAAQALTKEIRTTLVLKVSIKDIIFKGFSKDLAFLKRGLSISMSGTFTDKCHIRT